MNVYNGHMIQILISNLILVNYLHFSLMINVLYVIHNVILVINKIIVHNVNLILLNLVNHVIVVKGIIWMDRIIVKSVLINVLVV